MYPASLGAIPERIFVRIFKEVVKAVSALGVSRRVVRATRTVPVEACRMDVVASMNVKRRKGEGVVV